MCERLSSDKSLDNRPDIPVASIKIDKKQVFKANDSRQIFHDSEFLLVLAAEKQQGGVCREFRYLIIDRYFRITKDRGQTSKACDPFLFLYRTPLTIKKEPETGYQVS